MKKNYKKGFTLIELLVVIAIIGILASIILASLATARSKGVDATTKSDLGSVGAQMEIYNSSNTTGYTGGCAALGNATPPGVGTILAGAQSNANASFTTAGTYKADSAAIGVYNQVTCNDSGTAWAAQAPLSNSTTGTPSFWCVDSTGQSHAEATVLAASATVCP
jgi:type IV pilus assembly protein PilA